MVANEVNKVKKEIKRCENKLEKEMIGVKQQFEKERGEQDSKAQRLAAYQEAEIERVKQQVREVKEKVDVSNVEITNSIKEDVNAIQERLNKVEGISHELFHLNSGVDRIQQKLDENPSKVSRQLREQDRQTEQNNKRSSSIHESSLGLTGDVTEGGVKFLRPRADKLDAELDKKANVTRGSTDNCEVQVPKKRSKLDPRNIQDKNLGTIVEQSNPKIWKVNVKMKEIARMRKSKKRKVKFKWRFQVGNQLLDKGQQVSNTIDQMKEIAKIRKSKKTKVKFKWQHHVGEQVLAKRQPVSDAVKRLYEGPLVIKEVVNVYLNKLQTKSGNIKGLFHISHLKSYVTPD
jgi:hypothetical protein